MGPIGARKAIARAACGVVLSWQMRLDARRTCLVLSRVSLRDALRAALLVTLSGRLSERKKIRGFTLVEMLLVLLVIGLAAGLNYARLEADPRQTLDHESRQLAAA